MTKYDLLRLDKNPYTEFNKNLPNYYGDSLREVLWNSFARSYNGGCPKDIAFRLAKIDFTLWMGAEEHFSQIIDDVFNDSHLDRLYWGTKVDATTH